MGSGAIEAFLTALKERRKVRVHFVRANGTLASRLCAALDVGPVRRLRGHPERYQFWDYQGREGAPWLSLAPSRIMKVEATEETFDPAEFVTWSLAENPWSIPRDWARFS